MSTLAEGDVFGSSISSLLDSHLLCRLLGQAAVKTIARVGLLLEEEVGRRTLESHECKVNEPKLIMFPGLQVLEPGSLTPSSSHAPWR